MAKLANSVHGEGIESFLVYLSFLAFLLLFFVIIVSIARAFLCVALSLSFTCVCSFDARFFFKNHRPFLLLSRDDADRRVSLPVGSARCSVRANIRRDGRTSSRRTKTDVNLSMIRARRR